MSGKITVGEGVSPGGPQMNMKTFSPVLIALVLVLVSSEITPAAGYSCSSPSTVKQRCNADLAGFKRAVREKVLADMRASGTLCGSSVRVRIKRTATPRKTKPYEEILAGFVVSDVNSDPLHGVTITGSADPDTSLERCAVPVDVTVIVVIKSPGDYSEKRTTSRIELPGVYVK